MLNSFFLYFLIADFQIKVLVTEILLMQTNKLLEIFLFWLFHSRGYEITVDFYLSPLYINTCLGFAPGHPSLPVLHRLPLVNRDGSVSTTLSLCLDPLAFHSFFAAIWWAGSLRSTPNFLVLLGRRCYPCAFSFGNEWWRTLQCGFRIAHWKVFYGRSWAVYISFYSSLSFH